MQGEQDEGQFLCQQTFHSFNVAFRLSVALGKPWAACEVFEAIAESKVYKLLAYKLIIGNEEFQDALMRENRFQVHYHIFRSHGC